VTNQAIDYVKRRCSKVTIGDLYDALILSNYITLQLPGSFLAQSVLDMLCLKDGKERFYISPCSAVSSLICRRVMKRMRIRETNVRRKEAGAWCRRDDRHHDERGSLCSSKMRAIYVHVSKERNQVIIRRLDVNRTRTLPLHDILTEQKNKSC